MTTRITAPDARANGSTYIGPTVLDFRDGVAVTTVALPVATRAYLARRGYTVQDLDTPTPAGDPVVVEVPPVEADPAPEVDLDGLTVAQLRAYAKDHKIDLAGATRKADILAAIRGEGSEE